MPSPSFKPSVSILILSLVSCGPGSDSSARPDAVVPRWQGRVEIAEGLADSLRNQVPVRDSARQYPVDSILGLPIADTGVSLRQPYGPADLQASAPDGGSARALSSRYLVRWIVAGDTGKTRIIRRDLIGPALSARERAEAESTLAADAARLGISRSAVPFGVPGAKPLLVALLFDRAHHLWVQMSVADGELNRADVYDTTGTRVAMAEWPGDVDLSAGFIGDRVAYGIRADSAGVPQVVRVRF